MVTTVRHWSGHEAQALRQALRLSVRAFAEHLGVAARTVSKWESLGAATRPRPDTQAILDTALARAEPTAQQRFVRLVDTCVEESATNAVAAPAVIGSHVDYDTWADDLDRAMVSLSRQEFRLATMLLDRWTQRYERRSVDTLGMSLLGRSLRLQGKIRQDQGMLRGPLSAEQSYRQALAIYADLDMPRRVAQVELQLTVVEEMSGRLEVAAQRYADLAVDERLAARDRTRARLWVGTALSKLGRNDSAATYIEPAIAQFDELGEPTDWSVAHQKLALAHRGAGNLSQALRLIDVALANRPSDAPLQRVRLSTAHAHILLSDKATCDNGLAILNDAAALSAQYGMGHQLGSIQNIRRAFEQRA